MRFTGRRTALAALAGFLAVVCARPAAASDKFLEWLRRGERVPSAEEKIEYFSRAIKLWRGEYGNTLLASCHFFRGKAYASLDRYAQAIEDLGNALKLDPENVPAYRERGEAYLRSGNPRAALADFREFVSLKPEDMEGLLDRAEAHIGLGRWGSARQDFEAALRVDSADFRPWLGVGRCLEAAGRCEDALEYYDRAFQASGGKEPEAPYARAVCEATLGDRTRALEDFQRALPGLEEKAAELSRRAHPGYRLRQARLKLAEAYFTRGRFHQRWGQARAASQDFTQACRWGYASACGASTPEARTTQPKPAAKRRVRPRGDGAGDRIYAN